jgi:hypothetical protein
VPISAFLAGRAFDAEAVNAMSLAFGGACDALGLHPTAKDPATSLLAEKLIELAMAGVHGAQSLQTMTLKQFSENNAQAPNPYQPTKDNPAKPPRHGRASYRCWGALHRSDAYLRKGDWRSALVDFRRATNGFPDYGQGGRWGSIWPNTLAEILEHGACSNSFKSG